MSDELDAKSDAELNEMFAVEVAGWTFETFPNGALPQVKHWKRPGGIMTSIYTHGNFTKDANAVLPWLEKAERADFSYNPGTKDWTYDVLMPWAAHCVIGEQPTFARAVATALIRSKRDRIAAVVVRQSS